MLIEDCPCRGVIGEKCRKLLEECPPGCFAEGTTSVVSRLGL